MVGVRTTPRVIFPVDRRVNTPTIPAIGVNSEILIKVGVNRTTSFVSDPVFDSISNGMGVVRSHRAIANTVDGYVVIRGSFRGRYTPNFNRVHSPGTISGRRVTRVIGRYNVINVNNTNFPAKIGLTPGGTRSVSCLVVGNTRYRPCLASSCHLVARHANGVVANISLTLHLFGGTGTIITVRSGGPSTVGRFRTRYGKLSGVDIVPLGAGCPRNNRHHLVTDMANEGVGSRALPTSTNMVILGITATCTVCRTIYTDGPLVREIMAVANSKTGHPNGVSILLNAPTSFLVRRYNKLGRGARGVVYNKPVVNFTIPGLRFPMAGAFSSILTLADSSIIGVGAATYVRYNEYINTYPRGLIPRLVTTSIGTRSCRRCRGLNNVRYVRYNYYACIYPTGEPLARSFGLTGTRVETSGGSGWKKVTLYVVFQFRHVWKVETLPPGLY